MATPAAMALLEKQGVNPGTLLMRHANGDWGECGTIDAQLNNDAVECGMRVLSVYHLPDAENRVWILTEADRASTCLLLPSEY